MYQYYFLMLYKMANLSDELNGLTHNELQYAIDSYFLSFISLRL